MARLDRYLTKSEANSAKQSIDPGRIYMAVVKDTRSVTRSGEIKVWIMGSGIPEEDSERWVIASYASTFYGTSPYEANENNNSDNAITSFGAWFPMPYVGNKVFVFYPQITGGLATPYWFASPVNLMMSSMLPGIPGQFYGNNHYPVAENNDKIPHNDSTARGQTLAKREQGRPVYSPLKNALEKQGLIKDGLRGYSTSGSKRESPSMCYGILTPLGNSFTMDDGWSEDDAHQNWNLGDENTELKDMNGLTPDKRADNRQDAGFRLRTRNGTQLLISDNGTIYAINRDGTAWMEMTSDGSIQAYAQKSADIACDGDINLHSKKKIRMEADEGFVFKTKGNVSFESNGDFNLSTPHLITDRMISAEEINTKRGNIENFVSASSQINGIFAGTLQGSALYATSAGTIPMPQPQPTTPLSPTMEPNIASSNSVPTTNGQTIESIVTAIPSQEPYDGHQKVANAPKLDISVQPYYNSERISSSSPYVSNQIASQTPVPPDSTKDKTIPQLQLSEHFTLADLCYSDTAFRNNISNVPNEPEIAKLKTLANKVLEPIWAYYNQRVIVNSGYRGPTLNALVHGASTSQHCYGEAADIEISGISNYDLACYVRDNLQFDQVILEFATNLNVDPNSGWVHVSYREGRLRHQTLTINRYGTKSGLIK